MDSVAVPLDGGGVLPPADGVLASPSRRRDVIAVGYGPAGLAVICGIVLPARTCCSPWTPVKVMM